MCYKMGHGSLNAILPNRYGTVPGFFEWILCGFRIFDRQNKREPDRRASPAREQACSKGAPPGAKHGGVSLRHPAGDYDCQPWLWVGLASLHLPLCLEPVLRSIGALTPLVTHSLAAISAFYSSPFCTSSWENWHPSRSPFNEPRVSSYGLAYRYPGFTGFSYPLVWALNGTANAFLRLVGIPPTSEPEAAHSEEELRLILAHSHAPRHFGS